MLLLALTIAARAEAPAPATGSYGTLTLGFDPKTREITGYHEDHTGSEGQFSCIFALRGVLAGDTAALATAYPEDGEKIPGTLTFSGDTVQIKLEREHGGCWNVQHFADPTPASFSLEEAAPWVAVRIVASERAYFRSTPGGKPRRAYVVKGDLVGVTETSGEWGYVVYTNAAGKVTRGWIAASDLYPLP